MKQKIKEMMLIIDHIIFRRNAKFVFEDDETLLEWRKFQYKTILEYFKRYPEEASMKLSKDSKSVKQLAESFIAICINEMKINQSKISDKIKELLEQKRLVADQIDTLLETYRIKNTLEYAFDEILAKQMLKKVKELKH